MFVSRLFSRDLLTIVDLFQFCRRYVTDGSQKPAVVEPIDPLKSGELHVV